MNRPTSTATKNAVPTGSVTSTADSNQTHQCGTLALWAAQPLIWCIYLYRVTLSPFIGNSCRFWPTCSHYAEQALRTYGAWRGSITAARRLLRCHPWHEGGYDPVD